MDYNKNERTYESFREWCIEQASVDTSFIPGAVSVFDRAKAIHDWVLENPEPVMLWRYGPRFHTPIIEGIEDRIKDIKTQIEADGGELVKIHVMTLAVHKGDSEKLLYQKSW